jgi:eukaryotic-like serine/threonine-protein kinase
LGRRELVPLTPKAFYTLLVLVRNSGRLMTKDELMKAIWPDSFVEEANLTQTVFVLRRALGETREQRYIMTLQGQGYHFVANVKEISGNGHSAKVATASLDSGGEPPED